ncbi:hypothetical protein OROHE_010788 [Orobanche hederae]
MSLDLFSHLPDDGCPFTELTRGARWNNQDCCIPNGPKKLYPPEAGRALTMILRSKRALPGEGGDKWSTMPNSLKGYYFQELRLDKGEDKSLFDFFKRAKLNAKGAYVDKKFEDIAATVESRILDQDLTIEAINKIFLEVNPPDDKGFIYGLGSLGVALSAPSRGAIFLSLAWGMRILRAGPGLREELAKRDAEYLKLQEEQRLLAEQMQKDKDEMAARFAAHQQQVEELFRQMEAMRGSQPPSS